MKGLIISILCISIFLSGCTPSKNLSFQLGLLRQSQRYQQLHPTRPSHHTSLLHPIQRIPQLPKTQQSQQLNPPGLLQSGTATRCWVLL